MLPIARVACLALIALPTIVFAQTDDSAVPAATCVKPAVPALDAALDNKAAEKLNTEIKAYGACADAYMKARRAVATKHQDIANAHANAANGFAADFNSHQTALVEFSKARAAKADGKKK